MNISNKRTINVEHSSCKQFTEAAFLDSVKQDIDCIEYFYEPDSKLLSIKHYNAAFNCCPNKILAEIIIDSSLIRVEEREKLLNPCKCNCLYDLNYEISGVDAKKYTLEIIEPYLGNADEPLKFEIDLNINQHDTLMKKRTMYPWLF